MPGIRKRESPTPTVNLGSMLGGTTTIPEYGEAR